MDNKKQPTFQNYWLNMQVSVEENLKYYHRQREHAPTGTSQKNNAWLSCGERTDHLLQLTLHSDDLIGQLGELRGMGLVSRRAYRLVSRFQAVRQTLASQHFSAAPPGLQAEYQLLTEQVIPTLARINKRVAARHQQLAPGSIAGPQQVLAEDVLDVALRAAQKRRA